MYTIVYAMTARGIIPSTFTYKKAQQDIEVPRSDGTTSKGMIIGPLYWDKTRQAVMVRVVVGPFEKSVRLRELAKANPDITVTPIEWPDAWDSFGDIEGCAEFRSKVDAYVQSVIETAE